MNQNKIQCDVLIIGTGGAGIRAAIAAKDFGTNVILVTSKKHGYSGSTFYSNSMPWGIMTAGANQNDKEIFFEEIVKTSCGCLNKKLIQILVEQSNDRFLDLLSYGIKFRQLSDSNETPCFGTKSRGAQLIALENARESLLGQISKRDIEVIDNLYIFDLLVRDNTCSGVVGINHEGEMVIIGAKVVVMASGGAEYLWKYNIVTSDITGDGYAMAARAGARLTNMEFIQFIPGILSPLNKINFHHPTLGSIPYLYNDAGEEFLTKYLPGEVTLGKCLMERASHGPFSNEDNSRYFDIAICMEEKNSPKEGYRGIEVKYADSYYSDKKYERWREFLLSKGIDTKHDHLRIFPHCQGFNGGILIDENCSTDIENLYACGECAGGVHGANRIGGNAILATQVFGNIAGEEAAKKSKHVRDINASILNYSLKIYNMGKLSSLHPKEIMRSIKNIMQECACIVREEKKLKEAINKIEDMECQYNPYHYINEKGFIKEALSAYNSLITSKIVLSAMLYRKESRGSHYRVDFSNKYNEKYGKMNYVTLSEDNNILIRSE
ncbi:MAG: FAD-binding protein [Candidatus Humimicrobiaceae bacterium]